jgi:hypothetical protein
MSNDDLPQEGELLLCRRCSAPYEPEDEFCRKCGAPLQGSRMPAVRRDYQPTPWRPAVPTVVGGAAAIAAGTLAEIILRRLVKKIFKPSSLLPTLRNSSKKPAKIVEKEEEEEGMEPEARIESETFVLRRVRMRRRRGPD